MQNQPPGVNISDSKLSKRVWVRWLCIVLSIICLIVGTIGIIVPGLPTVDFYILASIFAAKGSSRLHGWITSNRWIAPILQQWHEHRTLPLKVKIISLVSMSLAAGLMIWKVPHPWFVAGAIVCMIAVQIWMWTRK
ncbi:DUF454 domain-containing protein [Acinetobacter qingfengensis]|uniref:Inner membrane protein n=1 Tax=Acinetobacter qingfengensis TaxID=1262585 RepID=A0A1E7R0D4_9GAMM|nr:YbaN family protein [Acinetobacter qingfengensis]KAA8734562.1 DUF454 domain-containing protein [Acinetobacter qingfengensis]OEY92753.1 hypothetical protein BJI46_14500 [Acinetobacter qingfengensis]